jgi:hypothetical protein
MFPIYKNLLNRIAAKNRTLTYEIPAVNLGMREDQLYASVAATKVIASHSVRAPKLTALKTQDDLNQMRLAATLSVADFLPAENYLGGD